MRTPTTPFLVVFLLLCSSVQSQENTSARFGKITPDDFKERTYAVDSGAAAVIIADIGTTHVVENRKGGFSLEFKNYRRAHVLAKSGYDMADVEIRLYRNNEQNLEEELNGLKAVTYNLVNGKVVESKVDVKSAIFTDKISKNLVIKKFTFPNVKEGSIIEYEYQIQSDFMFNLQPWDFQGGYPRLWSEYNVHIPQFYYYVTLFQGHQPFYISTEDTKRRIFVTSDNRSTGQTSRSTFDATVLHQRWVMKDVPALKEEAFTSTLNNHVARLQFQLSELRPPFVFKSVMSTWPKVCQELLNDEEFGLALDRDNGWMEKIIDEATSGATSYDEKAKRIYSFVRNNMSCTNYNRKYLDRPLRTVLQSRTGTAAEINILLTAMLRKAGVSADPVILSTRSHGYVYSMYPMMDRFNYVIAQARVGSETYYLDASRPLLGFGRLSAECYNGHARVVDPSATSIAFMPDSLVEKKYTSALFISDGKGGFTGNVKRKPGYIESLQIRSKVKDKGLSWITDDFRKEFNTPVNILSATVDSLDQYDESVYLKYDFSLESFDEDFIYFNPMMGEGWKENPFKAAERTYPIEMPYAIDEAFYFHLEVPTGYKLDEIPKQIVVKMNEQNDGTFEYRIVEENGKILLRSRVRIRRTVYHPEEYVMLREFFNLIVQKHAEQIVFKKIDG